MMAALVLKEMTKPSLGQSRNEDCPSIHELAALFEEIASAECCLVLVLQHVAKAASATSRGKLVCSAAQSRKALRSL
jgi:hypothetical protein